MVFEPCAAWCFTFDNVEEDKKRWWLTQVNKWKTLTVLEAMKQVNAFVLETYLQDGMPGRIDHEL